MKVAVLGYGTVGSGVVEILKEKEDVEVKWVYNRPNPIKQAKLGSLYTNDLNVILNDKEIDVIIEVLGGMVAYPIIKDALNHHKHVITANKDVVALYIDELVLLAKKNQVMVLFEASAGGGLPIIRNICDVVKSDEILEICGILNGTTNYILTRMQNEEITFENALKAAQESGFAEADPTNDIEGLDMVRKIGILTMLATNSKIDINEIYHYGIGGVNAQFIKGIQKDNKVLKLVARALIGEELQIIVEPVVFDRNHMFASIINANNGIMVMCKNHAQLFFGGLGAGKVPTASAVIDDLYMIKGMDNYLHYSGENVFHVSSLKELNDYYVLDDNQVILKKKISRDEAKKHQFYARVI